MVFINILIAIGCFRFGGNNPNKNVCCTISTSSAVGDHKTTSNHEQRKRDWLFWKKLM